MAKLNDARRSLERAKESALERLQQIENERREIKSSLKSLDAALKALGNFDSSIRNAAATSAEVIAAITLELKEHETRSFDELFIAVREKLQASRRSINGLKRQLQQALTQDRFATNEDGLVAIRHTDESDLNN